MKNFTKLLYLVFFAIGQLLIQVDGTFAVTANPDPIIYRQPDGSKLTIRLLGDEFIHWAVTPDGYTIMTNSSGTYEYAAIDKSGRLIFSGIQANDPASRRPSEVSWLQKTAKGLFFSKEQVNEMKSLMVAGGAPKAPLMGGFPVTGTRKLLMILANFSNTTTTYNQANFSNYMNQVNYNGTGSFRDFYIEVSYGQLTVNTTVTVWVTVPNTHDYYGPDTKWGEFAYEAVVAANNQAGVNFADYDNNLDGTVDGVAIIHQGQGQEETGNVNDIWSHSWELSSAGYSYAQRTFDGVQVDAYTTMPERNATGMGTIGVMCHEFGHNLGAPDFYDTNYGTGGSYTGTGRWDVMAGGSWNGSSGTKPAHPNAWIKAFFGWTSPVVLTTAQTRTLRNAQVYTDVVRYNTTTANEYFICENRQQTGFDVGIPGHGLIIYHVDGSYVSAHMNSNDINASSHQGLYPVCASATGNPPTVYGTINSGGCPYPGTGSKTTFSDATTPHSHSWAGANTGYPLTSISENTTTKEISFCFISCTATDDPANFTATSFSISQINLGWTLNSSSNPVLVACSMNSTFGTPVTGTSYAAGNTIPGGGTVLYNGTNTSFNHPGLNPNTTYYYKAWSVGSGANYSTGVTANATTTCSSYLPVSVSISASANPVCAGTSVTFTASPVNGGVAPVYQWKVNGTNVPGATNTTYAFSPADGNTVNCVLTSSEPCTTGNPATSNTISMSVMPVLLVGSVSESQVICENETPNQLTGVAPSNGTNPTYQWQSSLNNATFANIDGATELNYQPSSLTATTFYRQVQNASGTCGGPLPTNTLTLTVNPFLPVGVSISASSNPFCDGSSVIFIATPVNGGTNPGYQWKVNGNDVTGATNATCSLVPEDDDAVTCVVTSSETCTTGNPATSNTITMTVNPLLPVSVSIVSSANPVCDGTSVTYSATPVNGGTTPGYQWKVNGNDVTGATNSTCSFVPADGDAVTCVMTSSETCTTGNPATSNTVTMTVNPLLPVSISIAASANPVCEGASVTYTATPVNGGTTPAFQWQVNGLTVPGAISETYSYIPGDGNAVACILTSSATCASGDPAISNIIAMTVLPTLTIGSISANQAICGNSAPVLLTGIAPSNGSDPTYQWQSSLNNITFANIDGATMLDYQPGILPSTSYFRQIQDATGTCGGPLPTNTVTITVNQTLPVNVSVTASSNPVCEGTAVTFIATPVNGGTMPGYQWKVNGNNVSGATTATYTFVPANGNEVTCVLTSSETCATGNPATSDTVTMTVNPVLPVSISITASANPVCAGTSVTYTATPVNGGTSPGYQWKVNGNNVNGATNATYSSIPVNGNAVTCVLTSSEVCTTGNPATSNTVTMTVNPLLPVSVSIAVSANPVCAGTSVTYTAMPVNGGTSPGYQWKVDGNNVNGATGGTYSFIPVNGNTVKCVLESSESCTTGNPAMSNTVMMTVNPVLPVSISITASANPVCAGTSVTYTATPVNGGTEPEYQWKVDGNNVNGATNATYSSIPANGNTVACVLTSSETCTSGNPAMSNTVTMTVNPLLPVSISIAASANPVCAGTSVIYTATPVNGGTEPEYQWKVNGNDVISATNATYSFIPANGNTVKCVLESSESCTTGNPAMSNTVTMTVNPLLPVSISIAASANPICAGTSVTYSATPVNGGTSPGYQWKVNGNDVNSATNGNYSFIPVNGNAVTCVLTSSEVCTTGNPATSNTITMTVNPLLPVSVTIAASANPAVCAGTSVTYSATPVNGGTEPEYEWKVNGNDVISATNATYSFVPTNGDAVTCVLSSSEVCTTGNPATSNMVTMTVNPLLPVSVTIAASANPVCAGTSVTYSATPVNGGTSPGYQWKVNGNDVNSATNGNYSFVPTNGDAVTCVLTSSETCTTGNPATADPVIMGVTPILIAGSISANQTICATTVPVQLTGTPPSNGTNPTYQWQSSLNNATFANIDGATMLDYQPGALTANAWFRQLQNASGTCTGPLPTNTVTIIVKPLLNVSLSIVASSNPVCAGIPVTFTAIPVNGGTTPSYQWKVNGTDVTGATNPTYVFIPGNGSNISCEMTSSEECTTGNTALSNSLTMTVNPLLPVGVTIAASANNVCAGTAVSFTATPVNGGATPGYQWKVNGANVTGATNATYSYIPVNGNTVSCVLLSSESCTTGNPATSNALTMIVNPLLPVSVRIDVSDNPVCAGTSVTFTATHVNGGINPGYQWKINGSIVNGATNSTLTFVPANGNSVSCILTSSETCVTGNPATSNTVTMTVNPLLPVSVSVAASANPVCAGTSVSYTATPANGGTAPAYQWKVDGATITGATNATYTFVPVNGDDVNCVLTSNETCTAGNPAMSNTVTMTVNPLLPVSVSITVSANNICAGTPVTFLSTPVNGGLTPAYQWKVNGTNAPGATNASYTFAPSNGDQVTCVLTSSETCTTGNPASSNTVTVTVSPRLPVSISIVASSNPVCAGTLVTYSATPVNGGVTPAFQWKINGINIAGATNTSFSYSPSNGNAVSCVLTSSESCTSGNPSTSNVVTMTVNPILPVSVSIAESANPVCSGTPVTFTATPVNEGTMPAFQWIVSGKTIAGAVNSYYTFIPKNNNTVTCILTSNANCTTGNPATSNRVIMTVNPLQPVSVTIAASANPVYAGTVVTFTASPVNGGTSPVYLWRVNGNIVSGATTSIYAYIPVDGDVITSTLTSNATCAVNNPATSNTVVMSVSTVPTNNTLQNLNITGNQCFDATQVITVAGNGTTFTVHNGGRATMIAGQKIRYLPGTLVKRGGYMHGYITTNGQYCMSSPHGMVTTDTGAEQAPVDVSNLHMKIYPNPTNRNFTLELSGIDKSEKIRVTLYGMLGDKVLSSDLTGELRHNFSLSDKPAGIYIIKVDSGDQSITAKIIKQ